MKENLNGVNLEIVKKVADNYKNHPAEALTHFSATVKWHGGFNVKLQVRDLEQIIVDEPKWLAGLDEGPNPVELLLGALGSCMLIGFVATASFMEIKINSLEVEVSGDIDLQVFFGLKEGNAGYDKINTKFKVDSNANDDKLQEIISQVKKLSPVKNTLERNVQVDTLLIRI